MFIERINRLNVRALYRSSFLQDQEHLPAAQIINL